MWMMASRPDLCQYILNVIPSPIRAPTIAWRITIPVPGSRYANALEIKRPLENNPIKTINVKILFFFIVENFENLLNNC